MALLFVLIRILIRQGLANILYVLPRGSTKSFEVPSRLIQGYSVRASSIVRVIRLNGIVLPEADWANIETTVGR